MVCLNEPQHQCTVLHSVNSGLCRDQTCKPAIMQLISNHPVALPYAHLSMYMFTNCNISCRVELFIPLEHIYRFSLDIWCCLKRPSRLIPPGDVLVCFLTMRLCMCVCVCMLPYITCTCVQHQQTLLLFIGRNLDKLWGCHGDRSLHRREDHWPSFAIDTEPIRLHMKNYRVLGCWMFKAASPLLFHSAISAAQLSRISWQYHSVWEDKEGTELATLAMEQIFTFAFFILYKKFMKEIFILCILWNVCSLIGCFVN